MARPPQPAGAALRALILAHADTPEGYRACDAHHLPNFEQSAKTCERLARAGLLYPAKVPTHPLRYFGTAAAAAHFIATTPPKSKEQKQADNRERYAARVASQGRPPRAAKRAKPPKAAKAVKYKPVPIVIRKAYSPPAPRKDAEIVWPAQMPECRMMGLGRYEVNLPLRRIGQPGWSMSV